MPALRGCHPRTGIYPHRETEPCRMDALNAVLQELVAEVPGVSGTSVMGAP